MIRAMWVLYSKADLVSMQALTGGLHLGAAGASRGFARSLRGEAVQDDPRRAEEDDQDQAGTGQLQKPFGVSRDRLVALPPQGPLLGRLDGGDRDEEQKERS